MNPQSERKLQGVFRVVFKLPPDANAGGLEQLNTPAWDSIAHVSLVTGIESEFDVSLDAVDQLRMTSYETTRAVLEERGL